MIYNERDERHSHVLQAARQIMTAARTAPKAKGLDIVEIAMVDKEDIEGLSVRMEQISQETGMMFLLRDAGNLAEAECVVLIGTRRLAQGLNCGYCGSSSCAERAAGVPCTLNSIDVGIAIGSACATATDQRLDTRVMFSAGWAAQQLGYLTEEVEQVIAIAISASSKNPFFDRRAKK